MSNEYITQAATQKSVQVFGRKKTAIALGHAKSGVGLIKINGTPLELIQPETLRTKASFDKCFIIMQSVFMFLVIAFIFAYQSI